MSYQYPPPPGDDSSPRSTAERPFQLPPVISIEQGLPQEVEAGSPPDEKSDSLKRTASNANGRGQSAAEAALAASAEKRRNKLGYHRTSVACGHCRRRKIRCVLAPGDIEHRCENCIRLKKDCNFYPVDAVPPITGGRSPRAMNGGRDSGRPMSGSPASHIYAPSDPSRGFPYNTNLKHISLPSSTLPPGRQYEDSPRSAAPIYDTLHEYPSSAPNQWMGNDSPSGPRLPQDGSYWRMNPQEPPLAPSFPTYSADLHVPQQHAWPPNSAESTLREDPTWSNRSVSFGSMNNSSHQSSYPQFSQPSNQTIGRDGLIPRGGPQPVPAYLGRTADNTPISSSANSDGTNGEHSSLSGSQQLPPFPAVQGGFTAQAPLGSNTFPKHTLPSTSEPYQPWYPPGSNMAASPQGPGEGSQPLPYGQPPSYGGMYYDDGPPSGR